MSEQPHEAAPDQVAIRSLYERWFGAMQEGDVEKLLSLLTPDCVLKMLAGPPIQGIEDVRAALHGFHSTYTEAVEYSVEEIEVSGDLAHVRLRERALLRARSDGTETTVEGVHRAVLRRQPDGAWLVARDVSSIQ